MAHTEVTQAVARAQLRLWLGEQVLRLGRARFPQLRGYGLRRRRAMASEAKRVRSYGSPPSSTGWANQPTTNRCSATDRRMVTVIWPAIPVDLLATLAWYQGPHSWKTDDRLARPRRSCAGSRSDDVRVPLLGRRTALRQLSGWLTHCNAFHAVSRWSNASCADSLVEE